MSSLLRGDKLESRFSSNHVSRPITFLVQSRSSSNHVSRPVFARAPHCRLARLHLVPQVMEATPEWRTHLEVAAAATDNASVRAAACVRRALDGG